MLPDSNWRFAEHCCKSRLPYVLHHGTKVFTVISRGPYVASKNYIGDCSWFKNKPF